MIIRKLICSLALGTALLPASAVAQDADIVSDWLLQNKTWAVCPLEGHRGPNGQWVPNPGAFVIDPAKRTPTTGCVQAGPYVNQALPKRQRIGWYLQAVRNLKGGVDVIRACSKQIGQSNLPVPPCNTPIGPNLCQVCSKAP